VLTRRFEITDGANITGWCNYLRWWAISEITDRNLKTSEIDAKTRFLPKLIFFHNTSLCKLAIRGVRTREAILEFVQKNFQRFSEILHLLYRDLEIHFVSLNPIFYRMTRSGCFRARFCADNVHREVQTDYAWLRKFDFVRRATFLQQKRIFFFGASKRIFFLTVSHTRVHTHTHTHTAIHTYTYYTVIHPYTCTHTHLHTSCTHTACTHTHKLTHNPHTHTHIHNVHIHIHTHNYTHNHAHTQVSWNVDMLICWCVDVLMCWWVDVLMCWCVEMLICW